MAFALQNEVGTAAGANAYIDVATFKAYHDDRGNAYGTVSDASIEAAIIKATTYLDTRFRFVGYRAAGRPTQTTEWPRAAAFDHDKRQVTGIPPEVQHATAEYALRALTAAINPDPSRDATGARLATKSETVGPISSTISYTGGGVFQLPKYPVADMILRRAGLTRSSGDLMRA